MSTPRRAVGSLAVLAILGSALVAGLSPAPSSAQSQPSTDREPVAHGYGGAAASLDPRASQAAIDILERGGNAVDAAVGAAAMLGVVRPFDGSIGGGGFITIYLAEEDRTVTIGARSAAPEAFDIEAYHDVPVSQRFTGPESVAVPGLVAGWEKALRNYGTMSFRQVLQPAITTAKRGFIADEAYVNRLGSNLDRFPCFAYTRELYLGEEGGIPAVGDRVRNPDLAHAYQLIARHGADAFYRGPIAESIGEVLRDPEPGRDTQDCQVRRSADMRLTDLASYDARVKEPVSVKYRGYKLVGPGLPATGVITMGEALNIVEGFDMGSLPRGKALHYYLEALRLSFADRAAYIGEAWNWEGAIPLSEVPVEGLLSEDYAAERRALIEETAAEDPYPAGNPYEHQPGQKSGADWENPSTDSDDTGQGRRHETTNLVVTDRYGNVVEFTFTIVSIGGSAMAVPGYGFLLNNVLIGALPPGGARTYSNTAPTIVFKDGKPVFALGSPGGATIIPAVLQVSMNQIDFGMPLPDAVFEPRVVSENANVSSAAESLFLDSPEAAVLRDLGHELYDTGIIGNVAAVRLFPDGRVTAVAEPERRLGGGSAMVECPIKKGKPRQSCTRGH